MNDWESANASPSDLRAKPVISFICDLRLRSTEVAGLQLSDFDWRNDVHRTPTKRGGVQRIAHPPLSGVYANNGEFQISLGQIIFFRVTSCGS